MVRKRARELGLGGALSLLQVGTAHAGAGSTGGTANSTTDVGFVARSTQVNGSLAYPAGPGLYSYFQQLYVGPYLNTVLDNGQTIAEVLSNDLGAENPGTLSFNFPSCSLGTLSQDSNTQFSLPTDPAVPFSLTSLSPPSVPIGTHVNLNPQDPVATILSMSNAGMLGACRFGTGTNGVRVSTSSSGTLNLGIQTEEVNIGGSTFEVVINTLMGESTSTAWQVSGQLTAATASGAVAAPALSLTGCIVLAMLLVCWGKRLIGTRSRSSPTGPHRWGSRV